MRKGRWARDDGRGKVDEDTRAWEEDRGPAGKSKQEKMGMGRWVKLRGHGRQSDAGQRSPDGREREGHQVGERARDGRWERGAGRGKLARDTRVGKKRERAKQGLCRNGILNDRDTMCRGKRTRSERKGTIRKSSKRTVSEEQQRGTAVKSR